MALEQLIEITGVRGESNSPDLRGAVPVTGWSFAVDGDPADGSDGPRFDTFVFTKSVDSSTPLLLAMCARRSVVAQARLIVRSPGVGDPQVVVDLRGVVVTGVHTRSESGRSELTETVELRFASVWFGSAAVVDRRGTTAETNWFAWDLAANKPAG